MLSSGLFYTHFFPQNTKLCDIDTYYMPHTSCSWAGSRFGVLRSHKDDPQKLKPVLGCGCGWQLQEEVEERPGPDAEAQDLILQNSHQLYKWHSQLETAMSCETEGKYLQYAQALKGHVSTCDQILSQVCTISIPDPCDGPICSATHQQCFCSSAGVDVFPGFLYVLWFPMVIWYSVKKDLGRLGRLNPDTSLQVSHFSHNISGIR